MLPEPTTQRGRRSISKRDRAAFLAHLATGGTVREAAKLTGRDHSGYYDLRKTDDGFAAAWEDAIESGTQLLEGEAFRRAIDGCWVERYDGDGNLVWREHRPDNTTLITLLKGRRPEVYRDGVQLDVGGAVEFRVISAFAPDIEGEGELVDDQPAALTEGDA